METVAIAYLFFIGACFWSFASVLVYRLKSGKTGIFSGRSECGSCGKKLGWKELFPIFSWAFQRGRCVGCGKRISAIYPALEIVTGGLFVLIGTRFVELPQVLAGDFSEMARLGFFLAAAFVTVAFVFYDLLYQEIPDEVLVPAILAMGGLLAFLPEGNSLFRHFEPVLWNDALLSQGWNALLGAGAIYTFFYLQFLIPAGIHCLRNGRYRDAAEVLAYYVILPFAVTWDTAKQLLGKPFERFFAMVESPIAKVFGRSEESGNAEEALPAWIGLWDLRIAVFMGFLGGAKIAGLGVFLAYLVGSVVGLYVLAVRKERNVAIAFGPFLAIGLFLSFLFYEPITRMVLGLSVR